MHMHLDLKSDMALFICIFMVVKSDVGVLTSPGQPIRFPTAANLVLWVSVFCGQISNTDLTYVALLYFGLSLWNINSIVSVT